MLSEPKIEVRESWCKGCEFCIAVCRPGLLRLEDGKLSQAERRLREIQKKLMEALKNKAGNAEVQKLMRQLQQAMAEFLREMMKGMKNLPNWARPFNPNSQNLSSQDLQRMLHAVRCMQQIRDPATA